MKIYRQTAVLIMATLFMAGLSGFEAIAASKAEVDKLLLSAERGYPQKGAKLEEGRSIVETAYRAPGASNEQKAYALYLWAFYSYKQNALGRADSLFGALLKASAKLDTLEQHQLATRINDAGPNISFTVSSQNIRKLAVSMLDQLWATFQKRAEFLQRIDARPQMQSLLGLSGALLSSCHVRMTQDNDKSIDYDKYQRFDESIRNRADILRDTATGVKTNN